MPLGVPATADGGALFKFTTPVVARIDGDSAGIFAVSGLETMALRRDPEAPPGSPLQWQTLATVDGSGPISMQGAQALIITVECFLPLTFEQSTLNAAAVVVSEGTDSPVLMQIPVKATVNLTGSITLESSPSPGVTNGILPGDTANLAFLLSSTLQNLIIGTLSCNSADGSPFSSPGVTVAVPARGQVSVTLPVTCAAGTQPGFYDQIEFDYTSGNSQGDARVLIRLIVLPGRTVSLTSSVGTSVALAPGITLPCQITGNESGGTTPMTLLPGPVPAGVDLRLGPLTSLVGGTGGNNLDAILNMTIAVKGGTPVGPLPIPVTLNWSVAADDIHPALSGTFAIQITALPPEELTFSQQVLTPSGTALGGTATLTIRSDGSYTFTTHLRDSGFDSYQFQVRAALTTNSGIHLMAQHTGNVSGTLGSGKRDDDFSESGHNDWIGANWLDAKTATMSLSKSYQDSGIIGAGEDALSALMSFVAVDVIAGPIIALVVVLGDELTQLTGTAVLGPGALPGVIVAAGTAWLLGPGMVFPALVAGVAAGAVTDALIHSRKMTGDETAFVDQVFTGQVPYGQIWLTNLSNGGRAFTWPSPDGSILMNLGDAFDDPRNYADPNGSYKAKGQLLVHETTHAWQITHATFPLGLACDRLKDPSYDYGPPGPPFSTFTVEGQASIVDDWFAGNRVAQSGHSAGTGNEMDPADPFFPYIVNNIRSGDN